MKITLVALFLNKTILQCIDILAGMEKIKVLVLVQAEEWSDPWFSLSKGVSYPVDPDSFRDLNAVVLKDDPHFEEEYYPYYGKHACSLSGPHL